MGTRPPGVYRDTLVTPSLQQWCLAAMLWARADPVVCFRAAGTLLQLDGVAAAKPELWVPESADARSKLVVVHRGTVALNDRRRLGLITITSSARTIVDLAGVLDDEDLTAVVEDALNRGLTTPMSVTRCLDASVAEDAPVPRASVRSSPTAAINARPCQASR